MFMKKFNVKKLLVGILASANIWTVASVKNKAEKTAPVEPIPPIIDKSEQSLSREEQLNLIKKSTLNVLKNNSNKNIKEISLIDFYDNKITAYCNLENDENSIYIASFPLNCKNTSLSILKSLNNINKIKLEENIIQNNPFINDFAVKYYYNNFNFEKENYELLNAYQNTSIKTLIGVLSMEQRLFKFSFIVKNKATNVVSKIDHQVIFAMPNWNGFSLTLKNGKYNNLYEYLLDQKSVSYFTQIKKFSDLTTNFVKYCGNNIVTTSVLDQLSPSEKEELAKQTFIELIEAKAVEKIGKNNLENIQFLTMGKLVNTSDLSNENYDLASYFTYTKNGKKFLASITNNNLRYTPQSYFNLIDFFDNSTSLKHIYFNTMELDDNNFALKAFDKIYDGELSQNRQCFTSKISYLHNDFYSKDYAIINCLYLIKNIDGNYSYYNIKLTFDRASESELQDFLKNNPTKTEYDFYFEQLQNDKFTIMTTQNNIIEVGSNYTTTNEQTKTVNKNAEEELIM